MKFQTNAKQMLLPGTDAAATSSSNSNAINGVIRPQDVTLMRLSRAALLYRQRPESLPIAGTVRALPYSCTN